MKESTPTLRMVPPTSSMVAPMVTDNKGLFIMWPCSKALLQVEVLPQEKHLQQILTNNIPF